MNNLKNFENDEVCLISKNKNKSIWLEKLLNKKTKKAFLWGNLSVFIFLSCSGLGFAEQEVYDGLFIDGNGGAIYADKDLTIADSLFTNNSASHAGGAVYVDEDGKLSLGITVFLENTASSGGAISNEGGEITITEGVFSNNSANGNGGAIYSGEGKITITEGVFRNNSADSYGGAIWSNDAEIILGKGVFVGNSATTYEGGAIYNGSAGSVTLDEGIFINNSSDTHGGAVTSYSAFNITDKGVFIGNSAQLWGGAIHNNGTITINKGIFKNNQVINDDNEFVGMGGVFFNVEDITINEGKFINNKAGGEGGVFLNSGTIAIGKGIFINNESGYSGGVGHNRYGGIVTINEGVFIDNKTGHEEDNNEFSGNGGVFNNSGIITISEGAFINNEAAVDGGAIYNSDGTINFNLAEGKNLLFSGNLAHTGTTAEANSIYWDSGVLNVNLAADSVLDMRDPMVGGYLSNQINVEINKTGEGTWLLGGDNTFVSMRGTLSFQVNEGTLYLYKGGEVTNSNRLDSSAMVEKGNIYLIGDNSSFTLADRANLVLSIDNEAHVISASNIDLQEGSKVGVNYDTAFVTHINNVDNNRHNVLVLEGYENGSFNNKSDILAPAEGTLAVFAVGAYDYYDVTAKWNSDGTNKDTLSLYLPDKDYNPDRGGAHIVRAPLAIALNNPTNEVIKNRQKQLFTDRKGVFGDFKEINRHFWGTGFYNLSQMDQESNMAGYNLKTPGFALGYDDLIGKRHFLGVAITAAWPDYTAGNTELDGNDIRLAVYGGVKLNNDWELSYMAGYGCANLDQDRYYGGYKYRADYDFDTVSFAVGLAKQYKRSETSLIRPYVHYEYMKIDTDGYSEKGSGEYGLSMDSKNYGVDRVRVGFDYVKQAKENENRYWRAGLFWQGQYGDTTPKTRAYFNSNPMDSRFISYACSEDKDCLGVTLGYGVPISRNSDLHLSYTGLYGSKTDMQDFSVTFVRRF